MYNDAIKLRAYTLFLSPGHSPGGIADVLKTDYPKITAKTVRRWSEEPDNSGQTWHDKKAMVERDVRKRLEGQAASISAQVRSRTETLLSSLYERLTNDAPEIKSFEGAGYLFKTLSSFLIELEKGEKERWHPAVAGQIILEELNAIPEVRKIINKHWKNITERIRQRLDHATNTKEITIEPKALQ